MRFARFLVLLILCSAATFSQVAEFGVSGGIIGIGSKDLGSGYNLDGSWRLAFSMTLNSWRYFGGEFGYAYNRTQLKLDGQEYGGMAAHQGFGRMLLYATPEGSKIRPFASGGLHFTNFVPPGQTAQYGQGSTKFGVNYGGGVKVRVSGPWLVRFDARQYLQGKPFGLPGASGMLTINEFSVGIGFGI
jgi:opacity protein-like surface antigen